MNKRAEMKRAVRYRSGPGSFNEVYLGSMATAHLIRILSGKRYGHIGLQEAIDVASDSDIDRAWEDSSFQWILGHYRANGSRLYKFKVVKEEIE